MLGAVVFWALAVYGAVAIVWQSVHRIQRQRRHHKVPVTLILVVENAEREIEGTLRTLMVRTAFGDRERKILVIDVASQDETGAIVRRMAADHTCLEYLRVRDDNECLAELKAICLRIPRIGCIVDLRDRGLLREISEDVVSF
ncbi:MAG: hypothetical protein K6T83_07585 [Alicyclobacillus sp.]|nr:hypothetical protein [Alicyclobacillus sp.]